MPSITSEVSDLVKAIASKGRSALVHTGSDILRLGKAVSHRLTATTVADLKVIRATLYSRLVQPVAGARSNGEAKIDPALHDLGVQAVVIPPKGRGGRAGRPVEHLRAFRRLVTVTWRTSRETRITYAKVRDGLGRTLFGPPSRMPSSCGLAVLARTVITIARLIRCRQAQLRPAAPAPTARPAARPTGSGPAATGPLPDPQPAEDTAAAADAVPDAQPRSPGEHPQTSHPTTITLMSAALTHPSERPGPAPSSVITQERDGTDLALGGAAGESPAVVDLRHPRRSTSPIPQEPVLPRRSLFVRVADIHSVWTPVLLGIAAVALLPHAAANTDLGALEGWGLGMVLPPSAWLAVICAVSACVLELGRTEPRSRMLIALTGVLILTTTGLPSVVEGAARTNTPWVMAGFVDAVARDGAMVPGVDARFSWGGFFALWAWIRTAAGGPELDGVLHWAPPVFVAIWAIGVFAIARSLLGGIRAPWVAAWMFCGANWIEQDYFSPQATAIVLCLAVLAAALGPLAVPPGGGHGSEMSPDAAALGSVSRLRSMFAAWLAPLTPPQMTPNQTLLVWMIVVICELALVMTHQLTPFSFGAQLLLLIVVRRLWRPHLLFFLALAAITWIVLGAEEFWMNQLTLATSDVGDVGGAVSSAVTSRLIGDSGQLAVKLARVVVAVLVWSLAIIGALLRFRKEREVVIVAMAFVPGALVLGQSYGGEVLLRIFLYGLPLLAVLCVEALRPVARRWRKSAWPVFGVAMAALFASLVVIRGGNDGFSVVYPEQVALTREVLAEAPTGSKILGLRNQGPLYLSRVGEISHTASSPECNNLGNDVSECVAYEQPDVILVYPQMVTEGTLVYGLPASWATDAIAELTRSGEYAITRRSGPNIVLTRES